MDIGQTLWMAGLVCGLAALYDSHVHPPEAARCDWCDEPADDDNPLVSDDDGRTYCETPCFDRAHQEEEPCQR